MRHLDTKKKIVISFPMFLILHCVMILSTVSAEDEQKIRGPFWPSPPAETRIYFLESFSSPDDIGTTKESFFKALWDFIVGTEKRMIVRPFGIAVEPGGSRIYVADPGLGAVHVFDRKTQRYHLLNEAQGEKFLSPVSLALDQERRLYISDTIHGKIFLFDNELKYLLSFGGKESIKRPTGLVFAHDRLYVVDTARHEVIVYGNETQFLFRFGKRGIGKGEFNYPTGIAASQNGRIFINDSMNFRVQVFDLEGNFLSLIGSSGDSSGYFNRSKDLDLDSDGNLYVVDALFDTVQIFDSAGRFLLNFGEAGEREGEFWLPSGIAIDEKDRIYIADSYNSRIQVFQYVKPKANHE